MAFPFGSNRRSAASMGIRRTWTRTLRPFTIPERALDMIPGGLAWAGLGVVVIGAVVAPLALVSGAALLSLYVALRFALAGAANLWGLALIRRWSRLDWTAEYARRAGPDSLPLESVQHLVVIPNYREDLVTLRRTLGQLATQSRAAESISVVLAMEASEPGARDKGALLEAEFTARFRRFFVVCHPAGIAGEMRCKSANQAWAARWARRRLVEEQGVNANHLLVTTMDSDTIWHPDMFAALATLFATDAQRYATFWQAPIRYHGNVWRINPLLRILHAYSSAWELAYLAAPWWRALPMSSYSMSMHLLDGAGYWDSNVIADEWHMYIKAHFQRGEDLHLQPVFLPFHAHATTGRTLLGAVRERYLQTLRHAWGAKEIGYTVGQIASHPDVPLRGGLSLLLRVAHDNILGGLGWIVMLLGAQLPVLLHPHLMRQHMASGPFVLLQISVTIVTLLTVAFWLLDLRNRPARPAPWTWGERLTELASVPLLAIITFVCVALPVLHAQTQLLLGIPLEFRVARKE
jgi:hypothetical protein